MSEANEEKTSGDFREMGLRLAQEVIAFLKKKMEKASKYGRLGEIKLSFVGHSIGNVILRTAIAGRYTLVDSPFLYFEMPARYMHFFLQTVLWNLTWDTFIHTYLYLVHTWDIYIVQILYSIPDYGF